MATILTKKKDTTGAPATGDLTNSSGGAELAVNTADKRLYTKNSSNAVVEIGTNPGTAVTFVAGTASDPAITTTGDTNTGIFFPAADTIAFTEGGAEAMRISDAGNVGIGTSSPGSRLHVVGPALSTTTGLRLQDVTTDATNKLALIKAAHYTNSQAPVTMLFGSMSSAANSIRIGGSYSQENAATEITFYTAANNTTLNGTERMRITSAGEVLIGATTSLNSVASSKALVIESTLRPEVNLFRNNTNVVATSKFGQLNFWGNDTTSNTPIVHAFIEAVASLTHSAGDNPTDLVFGTTPDGSATVAEKMRLTEAGYLRLASGTGGIQFGGDTAAANALDDYEEGTWTPTTAGDATGAFSGQAGTYTKIGNQVTVHGQFVVSANFSSNNIGGLPFVAKVANTGVSGVYGISVVRNDSGNRYFQLTNASTNINVLSTMTGTGHNLTTSDGIIRFVMTYQTT
jgi:hypothetical protein